MKRLRGGTAHPKARQTLITIDIKHAFRKIGKHYTPDDLRKIAKKRGGDARHVGEAIRQIRDSGTVLVYSPESRTWSHETDADIIAARIDQKLEWLSLRTFQRECRAVRGEFDRNSVDKGLRRELIRLEGLCVMLGGAIGMTAHEVLEPTKA